MGWSLERAIQEKIPSRIEGFLGSRLVRGAIRIRDPASRIRDDQDPGNQEEKERASGDPTRRGRSARIPGPLASVARICGDPASLGPGPVMGCPVPLISCLMVTLPRPGRFQIFPMERSLLAVDRPGPERSS